MDGDLGLRVRRELKPVSLSDLGSISSFAATLAEIQKQSRLQSKSICIETSIDPAQLSKMMSGQAGIVWEKLEALMDVCGSELPLFWMLYQRGWDPSTLRRLESDLEKENRVLREQLAEEQRTRITIEGFVKRTVHGESQPVMTQ